jgi:Rod binding domain-containing protein
VSVPVSSGSPLPSSGLPTVNQTLEPAWVRKGSASTQKAYETALAFEQMLVEKLSQSLTASSGLGGEAGEEGESSEGSSGSGGASGPLSSMLPQALTSGVMSAGGLGLAAQMTRQLAGAAAQGSAGEIGPTTGGASASTGTGTHGAAEEVGPTTGGTSASTGASTPIPKNTPPSVVTPATGGTSA